MSTLENRVYGQVKRGISRYLRSNGWKPKQSWFVLQDDFATAVIALQSYRWAINEKRFTLNLGVRYSPIDRALRLYGHGLYDPDEVVWSCHWRERISKTGNLTDVWCQETWWTIEPKAEAADLIEEVVAALAASGIPRLRQAMSRDYIVEYWSSGKGGGMSNFQRLFYLSMLLHAAGRTDELILVLREMKRETDQFSQRTFQNLVRLLENLRWDGWHPTIAEH